MKCMRLHCDKNAKYRVGFRAWADEKKSGDYLEAMLGIVVCRDHKVKLTVDDVICDTGWAQIVAAVEQQGKATPVRSTVELVFKR